MGDGEWKIIFFCIFVGRIFLILYILLNFSIFFCTFLFAKHHHLYIYTHSFSFLFNSHIIIDTQSTYHIIIILLFLSSIIINYIIRYHISFFFFLLLSDIFDTYKFKYTFTNLYASLFYTFLFLYSASSLLFITPFLEKTQVNNTIKKEKRSIEL